MPCNHHVTSNGTTLFPKSCRLFVLVLSQAAFSVAEDQVTVFMDPEAGPPPFNARECIAMFDTLDQVQFICRDHPDMVPLLLYAERMAKDECERQFQNELWNCSEFSLLKMPKITKGRKLIFFCKSPGRM